MFTLTNLLYFLAGLVVCYAIIYVINWCKDLIEGLETLENENEELRMLLEYEKKN